MNENSSDCKDNFAIIKKMNNTTEWTNRSINNYCQVINISCSGGSSFGCKYQCHREGMYRESQYQYRFSVLLSVLVTVWFSNHVFFRLFDLAYYLYLCYLPVSLEFGMYITWINEIIANLHI